MIAIMPIMMGIFTGCFLVDISYRKVLIIDTPVEIIYYGWKKIGYAEDPGYTRGDIKVMKKL